MEPSGKDMDVEDHGLSQKAPLHAGETPDDGPQMSYFKLYKYADGKDYLLMIIGLLAAVASGLCLPIFAIVFGDFMNAFGEKAGVNEFKDKVATLAIYFLILACAACVSSYIESAFWMWTGNRQTNRIRALYLKSVLRQDIPFFDVHSTTGGLLSGLSEDSVIIQQATSDKVGAFVHQMATFLAGFVIAFVKGWDMALVMVGCLPLMFTAGSALVKATTLTTQRTQEAYAEANGIAHQAISQVRTVAANGQEEHTIAEYDSKLEAPFKTAIKLAIFNGSALGCINLVLFATYAAALFYGAWRVAHNVLGGYYTGGQVMSVVISALIGGFSVGQGAPHLAAFSKGVAAARRVFRVIDRKPDIDIDQEGATLKEVQGTLELRDVHFHYPSRPDVTIFSGFSLVVPGGKTVALVGGSGSGKSTVVQLIERFYDPISGQVLLDGVDVRTLQLRWLRSQVGLVSQEPTLFATTIYENIAMGRPGASATEIQAAAEAANAHKFISLLPLKYETHVGERGLQLSGGQKQRIAIARAILKNPRVLLLDEATSALDTESERVVQEALDRMVVGRTTVVVAHRLSTVQGADCIAVVQQGQIVEKGTHQQLLQKQDGVYTALVQVQMKAAQQEPSAASGTVLDSLVEAAKAGVLEQEAPLEEGVLQKSVVVSEEAGSVELVVVDPSASAANGVLNGATNGSSADNKALEGHASKGSLFRRKKAAPADAASKTSSDLPASAKKKEKEVVVPLSRLLKYNTKEWPYGLVGIVASAVQGAVQPVFAFVLVSVVVAFYGPRDRVVHKVSFYCWMIAVIGFGAFASAVVQQYCFSVLGQTLARRVRQQLLRSILHQEIAFFDDPANPTSTLTKKLAEDTTVIRGAVGDTLGVIAQNLMCLVIGYAIGLYYDWRMALLVTGILPLLIVAIVITNSYMLGADSAGGKLYEAANRTVTDAFSSARIIHAYNLQDTIAALYDRLSEPANRTVVRRSQIMGASMGYSQFMLFAMYALVIWFAGEEVASGRATFDEILKAFLAVVMAAMGIAQAQIGFPDMANAKGAVQRVFPLLDRRSAIDASSTEGQAPTGPIEGAIELRNVHFHYPSRKEVTIFNHFNLTIPAGRTVAVVGESGSGKSTVIALVERFYDPLEGAVLLDGVDIRQFNLKWLRSQMALVSQEPLLFSKSILDNIRFGNPEATMEQVVEAAKAANAHDFIEALPEKYLTQVGEQGMQLSGGQKQRIAIARAVVKEPRILLLDEATSALDAASEQLVQQALDKIMVGRTCIVVAHRLSTIRGADSIALVHRGAILEQGTHAQLMRIPEGGYAKLVAAQMQPQQQQQQQDPQA